MLDIESIKFPVLAMLDNKLPKGSIRNGNIFCENFVSIPANNFKSVIDIAKKRDLGIDFYYDSNPVQSRLLIYDVIDLPELGYKYSITGDLAYMYYTSFNERYVRYSVMCTRNQSECPEIRPVEYSLCLRENDILDLIGNQKIGNIIIRNPLGYYSHDTTILPFNIV
jgi:hypothetical protein